MRGTLIYVMGPSGSGKDSLLSALRPRLRGLPVAFARRYISRPACVGGEQHMALSAGSILSMEAQGRLAMRWSSHGCQYGIGRSIDGSLEHGICVIVNGSREYLPEALRRYPDLRPVPEANFLSRSEKRAPSLRGKSPFAVHVFVPYAQPACFHARGTTTHMRWANVPEAPVTGVRAYLKIKALL